MKQLALSEPHLIMMAGIPGSGKSYFAASFADTFKAPLVSYHDIKQTLFKQPQNERGESMAVKKVARILLPELLKTGSTVIYDGQLESDSERQAVSRLARRAGYKPVVIWVQTDTSTAKQRATRRTAKGYLSSDEFESAVKSFSAPNTTDNLVVISGKHTFASQLKIVLKKLTAERAKMPASKTPGLKVPPRSITVK